MDDELVSSQRDNAEESVADSLPPDATVPQQEDYERAFELASGFGELAQKLFSAGDVGAVMGQIVVTATQVVVGAEIASVTVLDERGRFATPAFTDAVAVELDRVQYRTGEGPCVEATRRGGVGLAACADLRVEPPWPRFAAGAVGLGVCSVLAVGLFPDMDPPRLGALNIYARAPGGLSGSDVDVAVVLAAHLSTAVLAVQSLESQRERVDHLSLALESRDVIGQAKGILMARRGLSAGEAFAVLSEASQRLNIKLRELAARIADGQNPL